MAGRLLLASLARRAASHSTSAMPALCASVSTSQLQAAAQRFAAPALAHAFTSSSLAAQSLQSSLSKELKHEKADYEKPDIIAKGPPAPFTLEEQPGDTAITLKREYKGETISVDASVNLQDNLAMGVGGDEGGEEGEDEYESSDVNFNVTVTKGDKSLVFECVSDGTYMDIRHVSFEPEEGLDMETAYTGPVFQELDDELQEHFRSYLTARGINEDLGEYLRFLLFDKEQVEYMRWLKQVSEFVGGK